MKSWIESANRPGCDFPIENLPYGVFRRGSSPPAIGVAIGDFILDLRACADVGLFQWRIEIKAACSSSTLNALMALGRTHWLTLRERLTELLQENSSYRSKVEPMLVKQEQADMLLPVSIPNYSDFFTSLYHAENVGRIFRPDAPLNPNYKFVPIAYHGRASSVVVSGTPIKRPHGQSRPAGAANPVFGPCQALDYELEMGFFIGPGNSLGSPIPIEKAPEHVFGVCLLNDWSARDIQFWESQPLGPFLGKSFATSISPWVVTMEALAPYRIPAFQRAAGDPTPLAYLNSANDQQLGGLDIQLDALISTTLMRANPGQEPAPLCHSNLRHSYWTYSQMVTHHTSNGCNLQPGDLLGSGTASAPSPESLGCLLERTNNAMQPIHFANGEERTYLEDSDEVILRAFAERPGLPRIGFGECRGRILPA